ncbi:hypothetical protein MRX96_000599 [Rhipicephalus microplus]
MPLGVYLDLHFPRFLRLFALISLSLPHTRVHYYEGAHLSLLLTFSASGEAHLFFCEPQTRALLIQRERRTKQKGGSAERVPSSSSRSA